MGDLASAPAWVFYAITGGVVGAALAAMGFALQKSGFGWGRFLVVLTLFFTGPLTERVVRPLFTQITWSNAQSEAILIKVMPELLASLKASFPDDYDKMIAKTTSLVRSAPSHGLKPDEMTAVVADIRKKYAPFLKFANDTTLSQLLDQEVIFHQAVLDREGPAMCSKLAMAGATALVSAGHIEPYMKIIDEQSATMFRAVRTGIDAPTSRDTPSDADWAAVMASAVSLGATDAHISSLASPNQNDPLLCPALIFFMRALALETSPSSLRASFLSDAMAS